MEKFGFVDRKILVTGATGFIGRHLVSRLIQADSNVAAFVLDEECGPVPWGIPTYRGNIQNFSDIQRAITRFQPEYIFHLAAQPLVDTAFRNVMDTLDSNICGSKNLLHACLDIKDKLKAICFVSTDKVYGFSKHANEFAMLAGIDHPYNASKVCADILAQMYGSVFGLPIAIIRSGNIYGEGDFNFDRIIPYSIFQCLKNEPIVLRSDGKYLRDYIYVDDMIDGYFAATTLVKNSPRCEPINFGSHEPISVLEVINTVFSVLGEEVKIIIKNQAKNEIPEQHLDWGFAKKLGWFPKTTFKEGIRKTVEWYKENLP